MPKILTSFAPAFIPVLKELARALPDLTIYTLHPEFTKMLVDIDLPARSLGQDLQQDLRELAYAAAAQTLVWTAVQKPPTETLSPLARHFMYSLPTYLYPRLGDLALLALAVDATKPDLILLHNDVEPSTRAVALWAKSRGVPCLHIPHAVYMDGFGRGPIGTDVHDLVTASHICTAGPYQDAWYRARGGSTRVTGLPQFDRLAKQIISKERALELLGLSPHRPVVTYASSWRQDTNLLGCHDGVVECYRAFLAAAKELPGVQWIVKCHPRGQNTEWHAEEAKKANLDCLVTHQHTEIVLAAQDAILAYSPSGIITEAAHVPGVHLLSIGGFAEDREVTTLGETKDDIKAGLLNVLGEPAPDARAFAYKYCGTPDGLAHMRVAQYAQELL